MTIWNQEVPYLHQSLRKAQKLDAIIGPEPDDGESIWGPEGNRLPEENGSFDKK